MAPAFSIVIPTYNRAHFLHEALESVWSQSLTSYEVLVIDDGSTDNTEQVLERWRDRIRIFKGQHEGVAAARNTGVVNARGRYIAFLDSDDTWLPHKLERQAALLEAEPEIGLLYGQMWSYHVDDPSNVRLDPYVVARSFDELLNGPNSVTTSTVVVRRECFQAVGLFDPSIKASSDYELWLRIARQFRVEFINEPLAVYRRHGVCINTNRDVLYEGYRRLYEVLLETYRHQFKDVKRVERHLATYEYLCGAKSLKEGKGCRARQLISAGIRRDPAFGRSMCKQGMPSWARLWLMVKPYLVYGLALLHVEREQCGGSAASRTR